MIAARCARRVVGCRLVALRALSILSGLLEHLGEHKTVRVTIEISYELFKKTKAAAASRGETLREFVSAAIETRIASTGTPIAAGSGWRSVFGLADPKA